jgi:hypothetical protein
MKVSPFCKRFKHSQLMGDTFTLPDVRSSIIRTIEGYHSHTNTDDSKRLEKEPQIIEIWIQNTDRILTVYDRAYHPLPYADTVIITGRVARPDGYVLHGQVFKKSNLYPIIEMEKHFLVYYSYERKYHKLASMQIHGYLCSYVYINVEMWSLMKRYIQRWIHIDTQEMEAWRGLPSWAFSWVFGEFLKFKSSSASLKKQSDFLRVKHAN